MDELTARTIAYLREIEQDGVSSEESKVAARALRQMIEEIEGIPGVRVSAEIIADADEEDCVF